jgi:5-methylthioadenosine/S-adenosylhomocysteine deaminase
MQASGITERVGAPRIRRITNVTALLGVDFEPDMVDITIVAGTISGIAAAAGDSVADHGGDTIDGTGLLAFPGMVDCHDHLRVLTPGLSIAEGVTLDEFLKVMWSTQREMGPTEYRMGALLGSLQRLKTGITTVADHCYTFHAPGLDEASLEGYEASGVRWVYARGIMTRPYEPVCERWEVAEARIRSLVDGGHVPAERLFVAPVSIRQATPEEYRRARILADELGCGVYTHVAETAPELDVWEAECGATPVRALDALGFLSDRTVLVHCVLLDDGEIALLA